eukprot:4709619-Prymnesium_polylepis.1
MHGTRVTPHEFPCSLWGVPPLGLLNTHYVHLTPRARPPHTHPPALLQQVARARARRHSVGSRMHGTWVAAHEFPCSLW